jgi:TRAP transporter TAXI family solute receptor
VILSLQIYNKTTWGFLMKHISKVILVASSLIATSTMANADQFLRMVSGPAGGSWYPLGAKIMQTMQSKIPGTAASNAPGGGISNVLAVNGGDAEIGWSYAHTVANGYNGNGKFKKQQKNIRYFATLYPATFQVAARKGSKITSFEDMANANISPGKPKWTGTAFAESIFADYGITFASIKKNGGVVHMVDYKESVALMKDGQIDVFMAATSVPQASFIELENSPGIRFISLPKHRIDRIVKNNPGYIHGVIPSGSYKSAPVNIPSLGIVTSMIVNKDLSDDMVYKMTKVFWENHGTFAEVKKIWNKVKFADALLGAPVPLHPGAAKYYKEKGLIK